MKRGADGADVGHIVVVVVAWRIDAISIVGVIVIAGAQPGTDADCHPKSTAYCRLFLKNIKLFYVFYCFDWEIPRLSSEWHGVVMLSGTKFSRNIPLGFHFLLGCRFTVRFFAIARNDRNCFDWEIPRLSSEWQGKTLRLRFAQFLKNLQCGVQTFGLCPRTGWQWCVVASASRGPVGFGALFVGILRLRLRSAQNDSVCHSELDYYVIPSPYCHSERTWGISSGCRFGWGDPSTALCTVFEKLTMRCANLRALPSDRVTMVCRCERVEGSPK